jgi:glucose dehydrogenase
MQMQIRDAIYLGLINLLSVALLLGSASVEAQVMEQTLPDVPRVTEQMLLNAQEDTANWLMYGRNYQAWRYSPLKQIHTGNIKKLVPKWAFQTGVPYDKFECTPIVGRVPEWYSMKDDEGNIVYSDLIEMIKDIRG